MRKDDLPKRKAIAKFEHIGDKVAGEVTACEWQADKFNPGEQVLAFTLNDGTDEVQLFARRRQQEAIREALEYAEADEILVGGWLELVYADDLETSAGVAKQWDAAYTPPAAAESRALWDD